MENAASIREGPTSDEIKEIYESMQIVQQLVYLYSEMIKCGLSEEATKVRLAITFIVSKFNLSENPQ